MEQNAEMALQKVSAEHDLKEEERVELIPILLFLLILEVSYFGVFDGFGKNLGWFFALVLLNACFLVAYLKQAAELRKNKETSLISKNNLSKAHERIEQSEENLRDISADLAKAREELASAKTELVEVNLAFDNCSLQLEITESELRVMQSESEAILANVKQGVFLINEDGTIGTQYSEELKNIFQIKDAASRNFMRLLRPLIPEKRHQTISSYVELLFNPKKNAKQLQRFNPLKCVELNFQHPEGGFAPKCVEFNFQRVFSGDSIRRVLITAVDVTERVRLESKLKEGEERREKQLELLCDLLNADNAQLRGFLKEAESVIAEVNDAFRAGSGEEVQAESVKDKVNRVFRIVHKLKSQAAALGLSLMEREIHQMENLLSDIRRNPRASNEDLLNVLVLISSFQVTLKEAGDLITKISDLGRSFRSDSRGSVDRLLQNTPTSELMSAAEDLCKTAAARTGKYARIDWNVKGFDGLKTQYQTVLRDAAFQLIRNAVVHGIEPPEKRLSLGKDRCGVISLTIKSEEQCHAVHLTCRDDGAGLDIEAIRTRIVRDGMLKHDEAMALPESEAYMLIFEPGFSTAESVNNDAGRGVGLDALHETISNQLQGDIQVEFGAGRYCKFELMIPVA